MIVGTVVGAGVFVFFCFRRFSRRFSDLPGETKPRAASTVRGLRLEELFLGFCWVKKRRFSETKGSHKKQTKYTKNGLKTCKLPFSSSFLSFSLVFSLLFASFVGFPTPKDVPRGESSFAEGLRAHQLHGEEGSSPVAPRGVPVLHPLGGAAAKM